MGRFLRAIARLIVSAIIAMAIYAILGVGLDKLSDVTTGSVHNAAEQTLALLAPISLGFFVLIALFVGSFVLLGHTQVFRTAAPAELRPTDS